MTTQTTTPNAASAEPATVWTAVIEWGSDYDDSTPGVHVGLTREDVARAAAQNVVSFWNGTTEDENGEKEWIADHPAPLDSPADLLVWLDEYREMFTAAWVTLSSRPLLGA